MASETEICETCGSVGRAVTRTKGSILIELILWLCCLLPGIIYSVWRLTSREKVCGRCGGKIISIQTPRGQQLWRTYHQQTSTPPPIPPIIVQPHAPEKKKGMGIFSSCLVVIAVFIIICGISAILSPSGSPFSTATATSHPSATAPAPSSPQPVVEAPVASTPIPKEVIYTIINENTIPGIKRSLEVRLNQKVSNEVLRSIAMKLKNSDPSTYERTFIDYYLPGMEVGAGAWATTHFNPNLEVRVLGLTVEEEKTLTEQPVDHTREKIGSWLNDGPLLQNRITIFRENGKLFMETTYKDGSSGKEELVESSSPLGRRFDKVGGSSAGDHWILDSNGNLQLRDDEGLIATAKKIN